MSHAPDLDTRNCILRPAKGIELLEPFNQQWNENNWTSFGSENSQDSCISLAEFNSTASTVAKPLPKLLSVHQLMDRLDCELSRCKALLKKTVDDLTDTNQLMNGNASEQKELVRKTEESVRNARTLLTKVHQHIANTHEFCNMLHRMDEALQLFSKTAYSVATLEQVKLEDPSRHGE
ncbi:unnamed protein product [Hydatigera taeniaeformis]|uniref:Biogenesis of lysosome-related organelles complex 1 subunit 7 n=1 Tax=Hydatigena taeniaeformis TaxID=6205 RepID=A0A0R3X612_HYDTA|nr:unnamed protein product [Hydatigera taeniaeformis]